jgi:hypothetical protein
MDTPKRFVRLSKEVCAPSCNLCVAKQVRAEIRLWRGLCFEVVPMVPLQVLELKGIVLHLPQDGSRI